MLPVLALVAALRTAGPDAGNLTRPAPSPFARVFAFTLHGERVGEVRVRFDGKAYRYEVQTTIRRGSALGTERRGCTTDAMGVGQTDDGRKLSGPLPSTLALWLFHDGDVNRCLDVDDEADGRRGALCATRRDRALEGTLLGEPFTAQLDDDGGPVAIELPQQKARFTLADAAEAVPAPRDLFASSRPAGPLAALEDAAEDVHVHGKGPGCEVDVRLSRQSPAHDEPLAAPTGAPRWISHAAALGLGTRTRWATAKALAAFIDQAIDSHLPDSTTEDPEAVWGARRGSCVGQARLFNALAGGLGLPSRLVYGLLVEDGRLAAHAWNEVEVGGRWYGVDASRGAAPVGPERIPLAREGESPPRGGRCLLGLSDMRWELLPR